MTVHPRRNSIGTRLTWILVATSSVALLLAAILFGLYDSRQAKAALAGDLRVASEVLGTNVRSGIEFDDAPFVREQLEQLERYAHVHAAAVTDESGKVFAEWTRTKRATSDYIDGAASDGARFSEESVVVKHDIVVGQMTLGAIHIESDLGPVTRRQERMIWVVSGGWLVCVALAFCMARVLQGSVSRPIGALSAVARRVREEGDYAVRAGRHSVWTSPPPRLYPTKVSSDRLTR